MKAFGYFLQPSQRHLDLHYFCGILLIVFVVLEKKNAV